MLKIGNTMNGSVLVAAVCGLLASADAAEWEDPAVNSIGRLPPRTWSVPLARESDAFTDELEYPSPFVKSLNGVWRLSWTGDPALRVKDFWREDFDDRAWHTVRVPGCLELQGFGSPGYVNWRYPFSLEFPKIVEGRDWRDPATNTVPRILDRDTERPNYNPVASYRTAFTLPAEWEGRRTILRFDGVASAYYVWVNGRKVGYAEDSKLPSEFDVTGFVRGGGRANVLAVEVYRWCDGSYLEDQDMFRFSGIFRDVAIWSMPNDGIWDFVVRTEFGDGYKSATISVEGIDGECRADLFDADGKRVASLTTKPSNHPTAQLSFPRLWSAEDPYLYTLVVRKGDDIRARRIGFKEQRVDGNRLLVNGRAVKLKGVNRHEHSPDHGRSVTLEEMVADIELMKRSNIDTVRTCHYPDDRRWYDLCDRYGVYVIAEANVEGHESYVYWPDKGLGAFPLWDHSIVERNVRQVGFLRNHPSVTVWSMGNETGHGDCFRHALAAVKALDPSRPTHWECGNPDADIDSRMYPPVWWLEERGRFGDGLADVMPGRKEKDRQDQTALKPMIMCEYAHAMGNAVGDLKEYWDVVYRYDSLIGGCIWDWIDQSLWKYTGRVDPKTGRPERYLAYGGDWDEEPNDGPFCCNGLIGADHRPTAKLAEVAHVYRGIAVSAEPESAAKGVFRLWNRYGFTGADKFDGRWELLADGVQVAAGRFQPPPVAPLAVGELVLAEVAQAVSSAPAGKELAVNLEFSLKDDAIWAKRGWKVARDQIPVAERPWLSAALADNPPAADKAAAVKDLGAEVVVEAGSTRAVFSRRTGTLSELTMDGVKVLGDVDGVVAGPRLTCARAFTDNDHWMRGAVQHENRREGNFFSKGLAQLSYHARPLKCEGGRVMSVVEVTGAKSAGFVHETLWSFRPDGSIRADNLVKPRGDLPKALPRIGLSFRLDPALERMEWYGRGPGDNYVDRCSGSFLGVWKSTVSEQFVDYARPQACGGKSAVRWVRFVDEGGKGVEFAASEPMFVAALHYTWEDLDFARHRAGEKRHRTPLVPRPEVCVDLDVRQTGLGGGSCGPRPLEKNIFDPRKEVRWTLAIRPAAGK